MNNAMANSHRAFGATLARRGPHLSPSIFGRPLEFRIHIWVLLIPFAGGMATGAEIDVKGLALLKGVEAARMRCESLKAELTADFISPRRESFKCLIEIDGNRRRFERFPKEGFPGEVVIGIGNDIKSYNRGTYNDVCLYDMDYAVKTKGEFSFDPRVLGLSDLLATDHTVQICLGYVNARHIEVVGKEKMHGADTWRVSVVAKYLTTEFWIEEPAFRVHRVLGNWPGGRFEIESKFDGADNSCPLPTLVWQVAQRRGRERSEKRFSVTSLELGIAIPDDRFTLAGMQLPLNTPVVDRRLMKRIGYWDGQGLSTVPVARSAQWVPATAGWHRRAILVLGGVTLALLAVVVVMWRRRIAANSDPPEQ